MEPCQTDLLVGQLQERAADLAIKLPFTLDVWIWQS